MQNNFWLFIGIISLVTVSCKKETPVSHPNQSTSTGDLRVTVRLHTSTGPPATTATVNAALTADSLANKQYIRSMQTDDFGYALFEDISWPKSTKHAIFVNAEQTDGGNLLKGTNAATLIEDRITNVTVILE